jgi:hypothetical protein
MTQGYERPVAPRLTKEDKHSWRYIGGGKVRCRKCGIETFEDRMKRGGWGICPGNQEHAI